ncbi:hypothetical protein KY343_03670 [Candidatus Woesearchaeota archaeon]|nr:hypothetical protein [Candidatus Woesearchaeota archaeon]
MGLDMFLIAKRYFWSNANDDEKLKELIIKGIFPEMKKFNLNYLSFEVGYWRKANQIHKWFVDNVQDGNDDCGSYDVSKEKLRQLRNMCEEALKAIKRKDIEKAEELLPTQDGFFFGSKEYDQYYIEDLKQTIKIIDACLKLPDDWDLEYSSSW